MKYQIMNPGGIEVGIPILSTKDGKDFYEGDVVDRQAIPSKTDKDFEYLLEQGYLTPVEDK